MNYLGIDVVTRDKAKLIRRLRRLVSTEEVTDGGVYHQDPNYSVVRVKTTKTESELDDWLYRANGIEYVGTFKLL